MTSKSWPELTEELARKALDVVYDRAHRMSEGELSAREMSLIASAVYDTITGLVPWDDANIIAAIAEETKE